VACGLNDVIAWRANDLGDVSSLFVFALGWCSAIDNFYCGGEVVVGEESVAPV
jgi:hypothetical protein